MEQGRLAAPNIPGWQGAILKGIGAPATPENLRFINAWARAEGGGATSNPFNTTQPGFGATGSYNSVGVRNYGTPQGGIQATEHTLTNGRYGNILAALRSGRSAMADAQALAASPWGTGSLVEKVLGGGPPVQSPPPGMGSPPPVMQHLAQQRLDPNLLSILNSGNRMFGLGDLPPELAPPRLPTGSGLAPPPLTPAHQPLPGGPPPTGGKSIGFLEKIASPFGLTVTSTTGGTHAPHSYHYQGRAVDFGGNPAHMAALANYALQHPGEFKELFYTGPGHPNYFISGGKVLPLSQLDRGLYLEHENHVHLAR